MKITKGEEYIKVCDKCIFELFLNDSVMVCISVCMMSIQAHTPQLTFHCSASAGGKLGYYGLLCDGVSVFHFHVPV